MTASFFVHINERGSEGSSVHELTVCSWSVYYFSAYSLIFRLIWFIYKVYFSKGDKSACFIPKKRTFPLKTSSFQHEFSTPPWKTPLKFNKIKAFFFGFPYFQHFDLLKTRVFPFDKSVLFIFCGCLNVEFPDIFIMNMTNFYTLSRSERS